MNTLRRLKEEVVEAGYQTDVVYAFCREAGNQLAGGGVWRIVTTRGPIHETFREGAVGAGDDAA